MKPDADVILAACRGDVEAMNRILQCYDGYITAHSYVVEEGGARVLNYEIKEKLQAALIEATLKFDPSRINLEKTKQAIALEDADAATRPV